MNKITSTASIQINAERLKVWDALINPQKIKQYLFGTETRTDWIIGHPITFEGEWEGKKYRDKGVVADVHEGFLLSYNYWSSMSGIEDKPENYLLVTFKIDVDHNKTILTVFQQGLIKQTHQECVANWQQVLKKIKEVVEE